MFWVRILCGVLGFDPLTVWTAVYAVAAIIAALATVGLLIGAMFAWKGAKAQLEEARAELLELTRGRQEAVRTRHAALMSELSRRWDDPLLAESRLTADLFSPDGLRRHVRRLYSVYDAELDVLLRAPNFFEDLSILEQEGAIPFRMIQRSLGSTLVGEWDHWKPTVLWMRGDAKYDLVYENFESLAEKVRAATPQLGR